MAKMDTKLGDLREPRITLMTRMGSVLLNRILATTSAKKWDGLAVARIMRPPATLWHCGQGSCAKRFGVRRYCAAFGKLIASRVETRF